jgi:hypothetical protein
MSRTQPHPQEGAAGRDLPSSLRAWGRRSADSLLGGMSSLTAAQFDALRASCPPMVTWAALADADVLVTGRPSIRAFLAQHWPLPELARGLANPDAVHEIAQHQVTWGLVSGPAAADFCDDSGPLGGLPLTLSPLERTWQRAGRAWFGPVSAADVRRGPRCPPLRGTALDRTDLYGIDPYQPDFYGLDPFSGANDDRILDLLAGLSGPLWPRAQSGVRCAGTTRAAAGALSARLGRTARLRPGSAAVVLGTVVAVLVDAGVGAVTARGAVLDLLAVLVPGTSTSITRPATRAELATYDWALLHLGEDPDQIGLAVAHRQGPHAWAINFAL